MTGRRVRTASYAGQKIRSASQRRHVGAVVYLDGTFPPVIIMRSDSAETVEARVARERRARWGAHENVAAVVADMVTGAVWTVTA